jgi:hypothetical protein
MARDRLESGTFGAYTPSMAGIAPQIHSPIIIVNNLRVYLFWYKAR